MSDILVRLKKFTESLAPDLAAAKEYLHHNLPADVKVLDAKPEKLQGGATAGIVVSAQREDKSRWGVEISFHPGHLVCKFFPKERGGKASNELFYDQHQALIGVREFIDTGVVPKGQVINDESVDATGEPKPQA